ncbi:hypothetical protein CJ030_MR5G003794 [Morella rubra]|uniref:Uncharacterized protein n=1 Tax=Morella rubra TaxID=262757 RepID=A0A6A1VNB3_9ROSI|nr:hypothetical protein CJ030_MR5G003794 [Morella rubra]
MSRLIIVQRDIKLVDFYDLTFEGRTLPEVVEEIGWLPLIHRIGYASRNLVREFYCVILQATDIEEPSMELTVRNVPIVFSPDELARFLGYERDLAAFPNLPMSEEGRPTKAEVFQTMLGDDTTILDRAYMDDVMPVGGKRLRCDSSVQTESNPGTLAVSGPSLRDRNELPSPTTASPYAWDCITQGSHGGKLIVHIPNGRTGGDDKASSMLSSHIGALVRQHVPFETKKNLESDEISPALLYKKTHTNKDGMWTSEDARENFEKMEALQLQHESEGKSYTEVEIFLRYWGRKWVTCGLGRSVRSVGSSSSATFVDLSRKIGGGQIRD